MLRRQILAKCVIAASCIQFIGAGSSLDAAEPKGPIVSEDVVFEEQNGLVVVEAEHFVRQERDQVRRWYVTSPEHQPDVKPDPDPVQLGGASGGAYVEALPDTFVKKGDLFKRGENVAPVPGSVAVLHYPIHFNTPGRYYLWTRSRSNTDEDNTLIAGVDDVWTSTTIILQFPVNKKVWFWRNEVRKAVPAPVGEEKRALIDIKEPGLHTVKFSMREDGNEFDRFLLTTDKNMPAPEGIGPAESPLKSGTLPEPWPLVPEPATAPVATAPVAK